MSRSRQALAVVIVALFGLWGCSRAPSNDNPNTADKLRAVEQKLARLEDDFRAASSARDQLSKKLLAAEEARTALTKQVDRLHSDVKSRDELLNTRTAERDQVTSQYKTLREGIKELLAKVEGESKPDGSPTAPVIPVSTNKAEAQNLPALPR
jgi:chromosome segregation ATPase